MTYKDKDKQKEADKTRQRRRRDKIKAKGVTDGGVTHFTDACGNEHEIDYEGRRKDRVLLESWADGKGTYQQQCMGQLSRDYEKTKGVDMDRFLPEPSPQCGRH